MAFRNRGARRGGIFSIMPDALRHARHRNEKDQHDEGGKRQPDIEVTLLLRLHIGGLAFRQYVFWQVFRMFGHDISPVMTCSISRVANSAVR